MYRNHVDEEYYAKDNVPSFYQFKDKYHFRDDLDRQYMIATRDRQVFANTRFKNTRPRSSVRSKEAEPFVNNYGLVKLNVKLADQKVDWFSRKDVGKSLILYDRSGRAYIVVLKSHEKSNVKRRTGSIMVKGLDKSTLTYLINQ